MLGAAAVGVALTLASAVGGAFGAWWLFADQNATTLSWGRAALSQGSVCHPSIRIGQAPSLQ